MPRTIATKDLYQAAAMLADGVRVIGVAAQFGVTPRTIESWRKRPEVQDLIAEIHADVRAGVKHLPIANKIHRLHIAQQMAEGALAVVADRKERGARGGQPGEKTGHVVVKEIATEHSTIYEASFDASVHAVVVKWFEYAAKELGDAPVAVNVKHTGTVRHLNKQLDLSGLTDEQLEQIVALADEVDSGQRTP